MKLKITTNIVQPINNEKLFPMQAYIFILLKGNRQAFHLNGWAMKFEDYGDDMKIDKIFYF